MRATRCRRSAGATARDADRRSRSAVGNPLGVGFSVSAESSARSTATSWTCRTTNYIQTDAAINHGNSGGPLFNLKEGRRREHGDDFAHHRLSGLAFAIPSEEARFVFERMAQGLDGEHLAWLGAKLQAVTPEMAEAMGQPQLRGSIVSWVLPDQPAQKAGIIMGDVILRFDGKTFPDERALRRAITVRMPGEQVTFSLRHNGQEIEVKVTLEPWPKSIWECNAALPPNLHVTVPPDLGLTVAQLTDALRASNEITADTKGVLVTEVEPGSDAEQQGVTIGDLVLQAGPQPCAEP